VKVIKTKSHNANNVVLQALISDDTDHDGKADWQNNEPDEVETDWKLLQTNSAGNAAKDELQGVADDMGDGSETVTRRYEFYHYAAAADTLDGENGEAMCSEVDPTTDPNHPQYLHGLGDHVAVTDANGDTQYVNCAAQVVVGTYIGAQMAGFDAAAALGLVDHLQEGERGTPYTPRTVVVGGNSPYVITIPHGSLPPGMSISDYPDPQTGLSAPGVLWGTPTAGGDFPFTVEATDANSNRVSQAYSLHIAGAANASTPTASPTPHGSPAPTTTPTATPTVTTTQTPVPSPPHADGNEPRRPLCRELRWEHRGDGQRDHHPREHHARQRGALRVRPGYSARRGGEHHAHRPSREQRAQRLRRVIKARNGGQRPFHPQTPDTSPSQ